MHTLPRTPTSATTLATTLATLAAALLVTAAPQAASGRAAAGEVALVQAVPGRSVDLVVDGRTVRRGVPGGTAIGPLRLSPGAHTVEFRGGGPATTARVQVAANRSTDVVLHRPASAQQPAVVSQYATPNQAIGPGKSRVLLAHTALVPPADVQLDGKTVFTNIANGEFASADVPAGAHRAALVLSGSGDPLLGPLALDLAPRTATMVYAVGSPSDSSMDVVTRTLRLRGDGSVAPTNVDTGSAGLVSDVEVHTFGPAGEASPRP